VIEEVERIWAAIDQHDDWQPLAEKVAQSATLGMRSVAATSAVLPMSLAPWGHGMENRLLPVS
jgi:hypothetical protein